MEGTRGRLATRSRSASSSTPRTASVDTWNHEGTAKTSEGPVGEPDTTGDRTTGRPSDATGSAGTVDPEP